MTTEITLILREVLLTETQKNEIIYARNFTVFDYLARLKGTAGIIKRIKKKARKRAYKHAWSVEKYHYYLS